MPPLAMGGPDSSGTFFSYSSNSVDLWTLNCLYNLHCRMDGALGGPIRQISTPPCPPSLPACALCIQGNSNVTIVATETGEVLTRFQAKGRIRCADYCVPKEILLVLTEDRVVTILSTMTNPVTPLDEWHKIEQWDWPGGQVKANIGKVCCMVLYSKIIDTQSALEEWKSLQMQKAHKPKKIKLNAKNRFLVILGHCGGCVSVLNMHSGKVLYRIPAHNNQDITSIQAYPDSGYLLTTGEDKALLVWNVSPSLQYLSLYFSVCCDLPPVRSALMGTQLILALQNPENDICSLVQYSLESQRRSDHQPNDDHHHKITGLCACHQLNVFASSSQDGTVQIWDKENRLLRILQLNAEPECLAYCEESGDLLLGITGDLYRISYTQLHSKRNDKWDSDSDLPTSWIPTKSYKCRKENCVAKKDSPERLKDTCMLDFGALMARHKDLESLRKGEVECKKRKPATIQTKQEAFNNYMRLMYMKPPDIKIPEEDMFDVNAELFPPKLPELCPLTPPSFPEGFFPNHRMAKRLHSSNKQTTQAPLGFIPNSVLVGQLWPDIKVEKVIPHTNRWRLRLDLGCDGEESKPDEVQILYNEEEEKEEEEPDMPYLTPITETPPEKENLHPPPPVVKKVIYPVKCISSSLNPKDFCLHLLDFIIRSSMSQKQSILNALLQLIQQEVLSKESLSRALLVCLQNCIHTNMSREEQHFVGELLNLMVHVRPGSFDTIVELLAILADKKVDLQGLILCVLQRLGVEDAEMWLCPELEHWNTLTKDEPKQHQSLRDMAAHWLSTWTRKYKVHSGSVFLHSKGIKSVITPIEVLQYFCSVQKNKQARAPPPPPEGRKDTVLVASSLPRLKRIQRLGETYSMSRIREPQGHLLPPLQYRPQLMGFTRFLSLPTAYVTLSPFPFSLDFRYSKKLLPHKYFFLDRSYVQYYR
ncbi:uncharacterized protein LOC130558855 isoform X2 [Triplophysa rosa]|uniref:uncharacterized protein LOC130558855 isoform X2 n=1 Tax=Triplophysa rosa TaxID=992332 RepID=UPI0025460F53|nr:uncharacterized protein LOC130558855 isoform X2 [Triplophysa rosa]